MNIKHLAAAAVAASGAIAMAAPASAVINAPVPTANYIVFAGQDWAWASPCAAYAPSCGGDALTAYQASQGWRIPTAAEFAAHPMAADWAAAGNPCASAWFGSGYSHCDVGDAAIGAWFSFGYPGGVYGDNPNADTLLVRGGAVPEPATWALMIGGFGLAGAALRRRRLALAA